MKKVGILCNNYGEFNLEASFKTGFEKNDCSVEVFEFDKALRSYIKFGRIGGILNRFLPVEPWIKKAARDISLSIKTYDPDLILITGGTTLQLGMLAFLKTYTKAKLLYLWQDPIVNLPSNLLSFNKLFDGVASFNQQYLITFKNLGFPNVFFAPLAADKNIHFINETSEDIIYDLSFIGGWRPEREYYLEKIIKKFPELSVKVWGTDWKEKSSSKLVISKTEGNPVRGNAFSKILNQSLISLNVIDEAGYPAANMRFFEIPIAGGLQLTTYCPEFSDVYKDNEHLLYFRNEDELYDKIKYCLENKKELLDIRKNGQQLTLQAHLYEHRAAEILENMDL